MSLVSGSLRGQDFFLLAVRNSELPKLSFLSWQNTGAGSVSVKKAVAETEEKGESSRKVQLN